MLLCVILSILFILPIMPVLRIGFGYTKCGPIYNSPPLSSSNQRESASEKMIKTRGSAMRAAASGSSGVLPWLLKYIIYVIIHRKERKGRKVVMTLSLRSLRPLR